MQLDWLSGVGTWAWHTSFSVGLVLNVAAVALVAVTRDRSFVNRWTGPWLGANLMLLGLGIGVPAMCWLLQTGLSLVPGFTLQK